ncbi:MAG: hypothetical protein KJ023_11510 [Burkholderiaceae bacterium]|nr:hypothetical protein [Burkholderiaceae bacterium]
MTRPLSPWFAAALTVVSVEVSAAGFGSGSSSTQLGQPLDFVVPVRTEAGEVIDPACIAAEVVVGERRLASGLVRTVVETVSAELSRVRVATSQAIDEPVVNVALSLGCPARMSRRFVVFAEPPMTAPPPALTQVAPIPITPSGQPFGAAPAPASPQAPQTPQTPSAPAAEPSPGTSTAPAPAPGTPPAPPPRPTAARPAPGTGERVVLRARPPGQAASRPARPRPPRPPVVAEARRPPPAPARPRLQLDVVEPPKPPQAEAIAQAMEAVAQAASAARAAEAAASAAAGRISALERTVEQLRSEARSNQEQATLLRQRLAESEETSRWMLPLAAAVLVLGALAGWLAWRLNALQRERRTDWRSPASSSGSSTTQAASTVAETHLNAPTTSFVTVPAVGTAPAGARWHRGTPAWPPPAVTPIDPWVSSDLGQTEAQAPADTRSEVTRTQPLPPLATADEGAPRDVTIEELIDLEQQAEFFVVLGQDEAAIDLLMEHLRSTGGGSPLPYLKLLEIYRRRGDHEAYERTRARFNHRFNAYAPEWGADLAAGRSLDDYPGVVPRLQQVWARPLDAMAELEALLFRKSRGELFDLPAYREVLLLYSLARDLLDRKPADSGNVDFLLPMSEAPTEFGATAPVPYLGLESDRTGPRGDEGDRPTRPVDLDTVHSPGPGPARPSLFGDLDPPTSPGPRRS